MARSDERTDAEEDGGADERTEEKSEPQGPPRRPYSTPKLFRLGSVRTLMLGASAGFPEGAGTFIKPM
jgi:hypothetical protein